MTEYRAQHDTTECRARHDATEYVVRGMIQLNIVHCMIQHNYFKEKVKVKSSMARSLPVENLLPQNVGSIINYLQQCSEQPNGELLVAVNHNQLRTMASETVDPIDWLHPPPSWAVPPERDVQSINRASSAGLERATAACEATTLPVRPLRVCIVSICAVLFKRVQSYLTFDIY